MAFGRPDRKWKEAPEGRVQMPEFGLPFSGMASNRKLTNEELIRAIRFMIAVEHEAIQLYMQHGESTDYKLAIEVLKDVADEERVHAESFFDFFVNWPRNRAITHTRPTKCEGDAVGRAP
jgi:hypothetical protein